MKPPTDEEFEKLINASLDKLPKRYLESLKNIAIVIADEPTLEQRKKLKLRCHQTLFGLYEGVPLTMRGNTLGILPPDKITIFKLPISAYSKNESELKDQVGRTVWHEVAHYYGLNHEQIHKLENRA